MLINDSEYIEIIESVKAKIKQSQYQAAVNVNRELILLYYHIGAVINEHKTWGNKFIEHLAVDIKLAFPGTTGYSVRNLKYMAKLAETYPDEQFVQQAVAQIPWGHNIVLLALICPLHTPAVDSLSTGIDMECIGGTLFYKNSFLFMLMWAGISCLWAGTLAGLTMLAAQFMRQSIFVMLTPFFITILWDNITALVINNQNLSFLYLFLSTIKAPQ